MQTPNTLSKKDSKLVTKLLKQGTLTLDAAGINCYYIKRCDYCPLLTKDDCVSILRRYTQQHYPELLI